MHYLILGVVFILMMALIVRRSNKQIKKKKIEKIRFEWGSPKNDLFDFDRIRRFSTISEDKKFHQITDQTITDIDFHQLFIFIDRTNSKVGQQFLFKKLIQPNADTKNPLTKFIDSFSSEASLREDIQMDISKLNHADAYHLHSLLKEKLLPKPKWIKLLVIDLILIACLFLLSLKFPVCLVILIIPLTLNMILHYWNKSNSFQFIRSFPQLNLLINVSRKLSNKGGIFHDTAVDTSVSKLKSFQQKLVMINSSQDGGIQAELSQLGMYVVELIKAFLLIELFALFSIIEELETKQSSILILFNYIGSIDTALSIASLRAGGLKTCEPKFIPTKKELSIRNMYHPLIEECTKNTLSSNKSILITGSNMSGKSTFLRTLLINSILSQTIYTCFADEFSMPIVRQVSSIRIDDNLFEGKSYYFQEVETMASLLSEVESAGQNLFVLDEIFKGTNTVERIASAKAILSYLNRNNNIVVASTHDVELTGMLEDEYDLYHFTETIENNELHFDHQIKRGPLKTGNAITLLELSNYPPDIIDEARQISKNFTTGYNR